MGTFSLIDFLGLLVSLNTNACSHLYTLIYAAFITTLPCHCVSRSSVVDTLQERLDFSEYKSLTLF